MLNLRKSWPLVFLAALSFAPSALAQTANGWRGNGTGLWPEANPPLEWHRIARGAFDGLRTTATRPKNDAAVDAPKVEKGLIRDWLMIGPFPLEDSVKDFDSDLLGGEATVEPTLGQKVGDKTWTALTVPPDDFMVFGTTEMPWLDLAKPLGYQRNQTGYVHTYLYSPRGGPARIVVDHAHGLKVWLNGKVAYRSPQRAMGLGSYAQISKHELHHLDFPSPRFDVTLKAGWNRLLAKLTTSNLAGYTEMRFTMRIMDPPNVAYDTKNIAWMAPLPARSTSTPILVGDRLFVLAEPDELLCLDKRDGRILWTAAANYYEALTAEERKANPAFAAKVDPLVAKLKREKERVQRVRLRAEIQKTLLTIDEERFKIAGNDHFEAHFGIVGFTMPTPLSDGKSIYVWNGLGVAACFDLDGQRQWITRVKTTELSYGSSPALADGVFVVFLNGLYGLDAKTGKQLWHQRKIRNNVAALLASTFAGQQVIITQRGDVVRPKTGELLFRPEGSHESGDTGWAPPVILGQLMYAPKYGVAGLKVFDFANVKGNQWEVHPIKALEMPQEISRGPGGKWIDRWTAGSPLVWDGLVYQNDIYQMLYVSDLTTGKLVYRQQMDMQGFTHYNSVAVAASPTLVGKHVLVADNQGTILVLEPGPKYKVLARNDIGTVMDRTWPVPSQETLTYAPPLADGDRLYLRGEAYMYCIGKK